MPGLKNGRLVASSSAICFRSFGNLGLLGTGWTGKSEAKGTGSVICTQAWTWRDRKGLSPAAGHTLESKKVLRWSGWVGGGWVAGV